jgi:hypothetical protein
MSAFDPAAWLASFSQAGGCYVVGPERTAFFVRDAGNPHFMKAKRMCADLDDDKLFDAINALVRERCLIA